LDKQLIKGDEEERGRDGKVQGNVRYSYREGD
jgi:hypothetical protein